MCIIFACSLTHGFWKQIQGGEGSGLVNSPNFLGLKYKTINLRLKLEEKGMDL